MVNRVQNSLLVIFVGGVLTSCKGQMPFGTEYLVLKQSVSLHNVKGRIDHMDANRNKQIAYVAALGNNSLEVIDIKDATILQSIKGLDEPQGVIFISRTDEIMVAEGGNGDCRFYNAKTFANTATIHLGSDADDVRFDSNDVKVYVGYGSGGIAMIDPIKHQKTAEVELPAHPEGFQLDKQLKKIFVNVPGASQVDVIDLQNFKLVEKWKTNYAANFPMAIDEVNHFIFIGYRQPARLVAINALTGSTIATADLAGDVDDLYYDPRTKRIYASGGSGSVDIYMFENSVMKQIANIKTRTGARTSLLIPETNMFILAKRASGDVPAQLDIFITKE